MADPFQNNITTLARRLKPFIMSTAVATLGTGISNMIYLFGKGTITVSAYAGSTAGLTAALAAASSGDEIWVLAHEIAGDCTIPAGVEVVGMGRRQTILTGQVTIEVGAILSNLSVNRTANDANDLVGVIGTEAGDSWLYNCNVKTEQAGAGLSVALYSSAAGCALHADHCMLYADSTGGTAYAGKYLPDDSAIFTRWCRLYGSTDIFND